MRTLTGREAIREALREEMLRDEKVFIMGEDITVYGGCFGVTGDLYKEFGEERVLDTPISECGMTDVAVGAAMAGMRPVCEIMFMDFMAYAADGLANQAAKIVGMFGGKVGVSLTLRTPAGAAGAGGQHTQSLEAWFCHIPGLYVMMPSVPYDLKGLLKTAIRSNNPVLFVEHKLGYRQKGEVPEEEYFIPLGQADIKREGNDVTVVATSYNVYRSLEAAKELEKEGISIEIIDPRTLVPLDLDTIIRSVKKTKHLLITHEAYERNGFGAEIAASIADSDAFYYLDAPIKRVCGMNTTIPYADVLEREVITNATQIADGVRQLLR